MRLLILVLLVSSYARADVDVDMPASGDQKLEIIRVSIDGCETLFKIKKEDFKRFSNNDAAMDELVAKANEHARSGCSK